MDILKMLQENAALLQERKCVIFFKVFDFVNDLEGPPLVNNSILISPYELETELSRLRDKWVEKFDNFLISLETACTCGCSTM